MGWLSDIFGVDDAAEQAGQSAQLMARGYEDSSNARGIGVQEGAGMAIDAMQDAENFIRSREALPMGIRDRALRGLDAFYQGPAEMMDTQGIKTQEELLAEAMNSPMYNAILGSRTAGEDAILRNAAATGGLRSGGSNRDLAEYNIDLQNRALMAGYQDAVDRDIRSIQRADEQIRRQDAERLRQIQGLGDLASMGDYTGAIADLIQQRGATRGRARQAAGDIQADAIMGSTGAHSEGQMAAEAIRQQGRQNIINTVGGAIEGFNRIGGLTGIGDLISFSDIRLKDDVRHIGSIGDVNIYGWTWNEKAKELGLEGECSGVLAHEVYQTNPEAIGEKDGYMTVNYSKVMV